VLAGLREEPLRLARLGVLGRVEQRQGPAEDLVGLVALDPPQPRVPAGDPAVRVEHEDRVVLHRLDQEAEGTSDSRSAGAASGANSPCGSPTTPRKVTPRSTILGHTCG
jgi:hypothetical protein